MNWYKIASISFKPDAFYNPQEDAIVHVDPKKFNDNWAQDKDFYVGPQGMGGIKGRYERFGEFLKKQTPINMPTVSIGPNGLVGFTDGRHRFAFLRDLGVSSIPIIVPLDQVDEFKKRFGAT